MIQDLKFTCEYNKTQVGLSSSRVVQESRPHKHNSVYVDEERWIRIRDKNCKAGTGLGQLSGDEAYPVSRRIVVKSMELDERLNKHRFRVTST